MLKPSYNEISDGYDLTSYGHSGALTVSTGATHSSSAQIALFSINDIGALMVNSPNNLVINAGMQGGVGFLVGQDSVDRETYHYSLSLAHVGNNLQWQPFIGTLESAYTIGTLHHPAYQH